MKSITSVFTIFLIFVCFACGETTSEKTVANETPKPTAVAKKMPETAKTVAETKAIPKQVSTDVQEKTAIAKEPMTKKKVEKEKVAASTKPTNNSEAQPTATNNTASNKSQAQMTEAIEKVMETTSKAIETTDKAVKTTEKAVETVTKATETPKPAKPDHAAWNTLLQKNVSATGKVNYKGFKAQKSTLQSYLDDLAANPPASDWGRKETMAYWINAYNAFTVKLIVDNYPLSSITNLDGGKPWDKKWIKLGDKTYSLNNIENDILRPKYKDARIHFAVNCAAQSCPPLLNKAWTAANLNANFDKQAKAFINNSKFNKISADAVEISKIFEWYAGDFGDIVTYLNKYSTTKINAGAKVSYMEYDWALNE